MAAAPDALFQTLPALGRLLRRRAVSAVELATLACDRLESLGAELNAAAAVTRGRALAEARRADRELADGRDRGPLHGIPYAAKDLFDTAGTATTWGAAPYAERVPERDARVIRRLEDAGAVLCGKLAMAELAGGLGYHRGDASLHGPMRNPWDRERWAGGSSAGSGAAVAAGLVPYALGTETWGSILCPAAFNGVTGLRPTFGRVSRAGAMPLSWSLDKVGPLARTAADCHAVLAAIEGGDPEDPAAVGGPALGAPSRGRDLSGIRAAVVRSDYARHGEPEAAQAFERALGELSTAGLDLEDARLPEFPFEAVAILIIQSEAVSAFEPLFASGEVRRLRDERAPLQAELARAIAGPDLVRAARLRRAMQEAMNRFFGRFDVIVAPNFLRVAPGVLEDLDDYFRGGDPVGAMGNLCGLPAVGLPMGFGRGRLPVGFQIVAPAFEEELALRVAEAYQARTGWHRERPDL